MMWRTLIPAMAASVLFGVAASSSMSRADDNTKLRVGVYDNRAIAVAYAPSQYNPAAAKMKEYKEAKAAENTERVKELEAWGKKHQRQLHRQGFGRVPVDDLLAHVKDRLPEVARKTGVDVIAFGCDYTAPNVEQVDITDELVRLFDPSERTLKRIAQVKNHKPADLDEIEQHHDD